MNKQIVLQAAVLDVVKALSELSLLVEKDKFTLNLFNASLETTGAMHCSLDEFICEWQTVLNNVKLDAVALYECWLKSTKFYRELSAEQKVNENFKDMGIESNDIVFEDGAYISCGVIKDPSTLTYEVRFYVELGRDCGRFKDFNEAAKWLWNNHSKIGYGL